MKRIKRLLAVIGIVLLALMYLITLLCAIFDVSSGMFLFRACVTCTILVPILLWGYTVIYRLAKGKHEQELEETLRQLDKETNANKKDEKKMK
ncbi:MAG: hypothetical protein K2N87_12665 [Eubacterium sp.]|nr:hypothetical protein [Eubacterium sp.]